MRYALYTAIVAGVGAVVYLGANLAILAKSPEPSRPLAALKRPAGGALVICGGGRLPDQIRNRFLELAGGPDAKIVVIPTAHPSADRPDVARALEVWKLRGASSVRLLHTRSRAEADDPDFARPLADATGVWIGGGTQSKLTDVYLGTEVERQLKALLARGGVIGGTSAGAAVMSRLMIAGGRTEPSLGQGFDLLPGTVIDQHFLKRKRMGRLLSVVRKHPDLIGLGIDEQTALVFDVYTRRLRVIGDSYVIAFVPETDKDRPGDFVPLPLRDGDEADLSALKQKAPDAVVSAINFDAL